MASTSLELSEHWEVFIRNEVASGRYGSASEVITDALRAMEANQGKLQALRAYLEVGARQAENGDFVEGFSVDALLQDLDDEH